jgi:hypothetical protein
LRSRRTHYFCKNYNKLLDIVKRECGFCTNYNNCGGQICMPRLDILTASQILAIAPGEPERLFSGDLESLRREFAVLAKCWHPGRNGSRDAAEVLERVVTLYDAARRKLAAGEWSEPGVLRLNTVTGRSLVLEVKRREKFELGEMVIAVDRVAFLVEREHAILFETGLRRIREIRYPDEKVRADLAVFMPHVQGVYETARRYGAIIAKAGDVVLLKDLVAHMGGQMPPKHTAWVVSSLLNLAAFFEIAGVTHNAISPETVFVSARHHAAYVLGGWWYAAPAGERIELLPEATYAVMPRSMAINKRADIRLDLESIRAVGRTILGDATGLGLVGRKDLPKPMANFLRLPSAKSAVEDYRAWRQALKDSFGPRRFTELPVSFSDVYP